MWEFASIRENSAPDISDAEEAGDSVYCQSRGLDVSVHDTAILSHGAHAGHTGLTLAPLIFTISFQFSILIKAL